jgi:integrase
MAWIERHPTSGRFKIAFRFEGRKYCKTVRVATEAEAERVAARVEETIDLVARGRVDPPPPACRDVAQFFLADGRPPTRPAAAPPTLEAFVREYLAARGNGVMEENSLATVRLHLRHFARVLGARFRLHTLEQSDLEGYVRKRTDPTGRRPVSGVTVRKEVASLRAAWNWAAAKKYVSGPFPNDELRYPKTDEKPVYRTRAEIERWLAGGNLDPAEAAAVWDALYLRKEEIAELLEYVKVHQSQPWVYPLLCTAAHTGARRSELLRLHPADVNFDNGQIEIHERKRSRVERTTRRVDMSPLLTEVLRVWLADHPGGPALFCQAGPIARSKKRSPATGYRGQGRRPTTKPGRAAPVHARIIPGPLPVTKDEAHDHLKRTLAGSKWSVLRGFHVLRHSFISCLAGAGTDQRIIDEFVGHSTEQQRRRYRHLVPDVKKHAIVSVFGPSPMPGPRDRPPSGR